MFTYSTILTGNLSNSQIPVSLGCPETVPIIEELLGRALLPNTYYVHPGVPGRLPRTKNPFSLTPENLPVGCYAGKRQA